MGREGDIEVGRGGTLRWGEGDIEVGREGDIEVGRGISTYCTSADGVP